jgi:hypothetical protein
MPKNEETKRDRFIRLAETRTNKILNMINLLGNCANTSIYEYTDADIDKIFGAIESEIREAKRKFNRSAPKKDSKFKL